MFYLRENETEQGPFSAEQIIAWVGEQRYTIFTPARRDSETDWKMIGSFLELSARHAPATLTAPTSDLPVQPAPADTQSAILTTTIASSAPTPIPAVTPVPPLAQQYMSSAQNTSGEQYPSYASIPWFRRSSTNLLFYLAQLLSCGIFPGGPLITFMLLSGGIYINKVDAQGRLQKWGMLNIAVSIMLSLGWLIALFTVVVGILGAISGVNSRSRM